jgi:hypothetical protein
VGNFDVPQKKMIAVAILMVVLILYIWTRVSASWTTQGVRKRVRQLTRECHSQNDTIFVVLNCAEVDVPMATANCFAAATCPQRVFVTAPISENGMIHMKHRVSSALSANMQPTILTKNFLSTIVYTRGDLVRQCVEESYRGESILLIAQGSGIFLPNFDMVVRHSVHGVRDSSQCLFTQFPPPHKLAMPGFPSLRGTREGRKMFCQPFARPGAGIVPLIAYNHQLVWFAAAARGKVDLSPTDLSGAVEIQAVFGPHIYTVGTAIRASPNSSGWWRRGWKVKGGRKTGDWRAKYGLSDGPTQKEIVLKLGSLRRYDDICHTEGVASIKDASSSRDVTA